MKTYGELSRAGNGLRLKYSSLYLMDVYACFFSVSATYLGGKF
jgi:hypothetical protein